MIKHRSFLIMLVIISACVVFLMQCVNSTENKSAISDKSYTAYAGSKSCASCHKSIYDSHLHTAHFMTSQNADSNNILGSFDSGKNSFQYLSGPVIKMEKRATGFYQVAYINGEEKRSQRIEMVFGAGSQGQSYATWAGNKLFQMPITYFTSANEWSNSPGYPNKIAYDRPITSRCMECHSTYVEKISAPATEPEEFDKGRVILGVDCEKCHGPGAKHVAFQTQNPQEKKSKFIVNPASFTRIQSLELCALCHGGRMQKTKPSFSFSAGEKLADYFAIDTTAKNVASIDVHGNQYGLLKASKCFQKSSTMTCNTCHKPHEEEKGKVEIFSQRCFGCHKDEHSPGEVCKMTAVAGEKINVNCTRCHMPEQSSMAITVLLQGHDVPTPATMHTHLIKTYPGETQKILDFLKTN